jgi:uncharacterized protein YbbK (DUF523 family)
MNADRKEVQREKKKKMRKKKRRTASLCPRVDIGLPFSASSLSRLLFVEDQLNTVFLSLLPEARSLSL